MQRDHPVQELWQHGGKVSLGVIHSSSCASESAPSTFIDVKAPFPSQSSDQKNNNLKPIFTSLSPLRMTQVTFRLVIVNITCSIFKWF